MRTWLQSEAKIGRTHDMRIEKNAENQTPNKEIKKQLQKRKRKKQKPKQIKKALVGFDGKLWNGENNLNFE